MKQRKNSTMLIVGITCALTVLALVNVVMSGQVNLQELFAKKEAAPAQEDVENAEQKNRANLSASLENSAKTPEAAPDAPGKLPGQSDELPAEPAIFIPKQQKYMPTENDSATSGQWYKDQSSTKKKGDEVAKDRKITGDTSE